MSDCQGCAVAYGHVWQKNSLFASGGSRAWASRGEKIKKGGKGRGRKNCSRGGGGGTGPEIVLCGRGDIRLSDFFVIKVSSIG